MTPQELVKKLKDDVVTAVEAFDDYAAGRVGKRVAQNHIRALGETLTQLERAEAEKRIHLHEFMSPEGRALYDPNSAVPQLARFTPGKEPATRFTLDVIPDQPSHGCALCLVHRRTGLTIAYSPKVEEYDNREQQQDKANFAYIAEVCNSYPRLVAILRELGRTELFLQDHPQKMAAHQAARTAVDTADRVIADWVLNAISRDKRRRRSRT